MEAATPAGQGLLEFVWLDIGHPSFASLLDICHSKQSRAHGSEELLHVALFSVIMVLSSLVCCLPSSVVVCLLLARSILLPSSSMMTSQPLSVLTSAIQRPGLPFMLPSLAQGHRLSPPVAAKELTPLASKFFPHRASLLPHSPSFSWFLKTIGTGLGTRKVGFLVCLWCCDHG